MSFLPLILHKIKRIIAALPKHVEVADNQYIMWTLVKGEIRRNDMLLDKEGLNILEAGSTNKTDHPPASVYGIGASTLNQI